MDEKPRKKEKILSKKLIMLLLFTGTLLAFLVLFSVFMSFNIFKNDFQSARTMAFISLIMLEIASAFNYRSFRKRVLNRSIFVNKYLFYASLVSIIATLLLVYTPLDSVFGIAPIPAIAWLYSLIPALILIIVFDVLKHINNKKKFLDLEHI